MTRLLIADDHAIVRRGLVDLLSAQAGVMVTAQAATAEETLRQAQRPDLDLILLDLNMPGSGGTALISQLQRERPFLPVLVLSMHDDGPTVSRALRAGASGFVTKGSSTEVLLEGVRRVARGERFVDPALAEEVTHERRADGEANPPLSERESQVLDLIVSGMRLGEIADTLNVSAKTISTHKMRLMQKLGVDNNADLIRRALGHPALRPHAKD